MASIQQAHQKQYSTGTSRSCPTRIWPLCHHSGHSGKICPLCVMGSPLVERVCPPHYRPPQPCRVLTTGVLSYIQLCTARAHCKHRTTGSGVEMAYQPVGYLVWCSTTCAASHNTAVALNPGKLPAPLSSAGRSVGGQIAVAGDNYAMPWVRRLSPEGKACMVAMGQPKSDTLSK